MQRDSTRPIRATSSLDITSAMARSAFGETLDSAQRQGWIRRGTRIDRYSNRKREEGRNGPAADLDYHAAGSKSVIESGARRTFSGNE